MLSRFGPLGLSVLSLLASFVIVLTAGGVLATTGNQAPSPPTSTKSPHPKAPDQQSFPVNVAAWPPGQDVPITDGVSARVLPSAPPPPGSATATSGSATELCVTLSNKWSLPSQSSDWTKHRAWTKARVQYCRSVDPRQPEITIVLEPTR